MVIDVEPAIAATAPAPIKVHHVAVVIPIKHIGMATTAMHHGPIHVNGIDDQLHIGLMGVILTIKVGHGGSIIEELWHPIAQPSSDSAAAGGTIVHINANACMVHQQGDSFNFLLR